MLVSIDNEEIFYLRYGRGVPVLVVHGGPGLSHAYFRPYLDALGQTAELIYVDLRGNGRSGGRDDVSSVTMEQWADDLETLRVAAKLGPCVVLGHGFGGFVAQLFAHRHPASTLGLILANTAPVLDYPASMIGGAREAGSPQAVAAVLASVMQPAASDDALRTAWKTALPAYFFRYQPVYGAALCDGLGFCALAYNRGLFGLAPHFTSLPWLHEVRAPTLLIGSRHDWWAPLPEGLQRLATHLPQAEQAIFEHSGHYPFVEETIGFCHAVRRFLKAI